jgi:isopenicillin N synthase-like dioxygenase
MSSAVVPTIDISAWTDGDGAERAAIASQVDHAGRTIGFMQIVGHGIDGTTIGDLTTAIDWFFRLPPDLKSATIAPRPTINRGYTPPRAERLSYSLGVASPEDLFEAFNVGASRSDFPREVAERLDAEVYAENIWPDPAGDPGAAAFVSQVGAWFAAARGLARRMTEILAVALGLDPDHFEAFTDHSIDVLRMNHYLVPSDFEPADEQMGMGAHTDYGIVTVLWADPVPGLEVLRADGSWLPVVPDPDALLINFGDLLARWSNDRWLSSMHRVVPPRSAAGDLIRRRSAAFFHDGNADALITTLEPCRGPDGSSNYDDVTVGAHLAQKLGGSRGGELNAHASREAARIAGERSTGEPA